MIRDIEVIPDRMLAAKIDGIFWSIVNTNYSYKKFQKLRRKAMKMHYWST